MAPNRPSDRRGTVVRSRSSSALCLASKRLLIFAQFCCLAGMVAAYSRNFTRLKSANELGVPECVGDADCVYGGVCAREPRGGASRCLCSSSCPLSVPVQCAEDNDYSCMTMGYGYTSRYDMRPPMCYYKRCICPPAFDANVLQPPIAGFAATLPMKCDRRELRAMIVASPSDAVYKGTEANIYCCVNVDPRTFISQNGVYFVQNGTRKIEPTTTPYENFSRDIDTLFTVPTCWILHVGGAQPSDGGTYACVVQPTGARYPTVNATLEFVVTNSEPPPTWPSSPPPSDESDAPSPPPPPPPPPDFLHNLQIHENTTSVVVTWTTPESVGHHPAPGVDFTLFDRYVKAKEVWRRTDARSPLLIDGLQPGTPYTLFMTLHRAGEPPGRGTATPLAGQIPFSRQFSTKPTSPDPPPLDAIRLVSAENGVGQLCEIEWRPAHREREFITRYYVKISGRLRYVSPELQTAEAESVAPDEDGGHGAVADEDYPPGAESCVNFYRDSDRYINATTFHKRFLACKYGPLKPNRNYSASVWVENEAGRSRPAVFEGQCVTDYAAPDRLPTPEPLAPANMSSFQLRFDSPPDERNGPIVCYYLAIVPLPANVSLADLPPPALVVMDTFDKALQNNLQPFAFASRRFFAYIAESYMQHPMAGATTTVGDGNVSGGAERCSVLYLARHRPMDPALTPNLKYTGFLVARVDRDRALQTAPVGDASAAAGPATANGRPLSRPMSGRARGGRPPRDAPTFIPLSAAEGAASLRRRQLANFDPDYGFSGYFEPVLLEEHPDGGFSVVPLLFALLLAVLAGALAAAVFLVCRRRQKHHRRIPAVGASANAGASRASGASTPWRARMARLYARVRWTARSKHDLLRASPPQPIRADELAGEYVMRHRDSNFHFTQEFEMLPRGKDLDHTTSDRNARKNRYNDIKACDSTRVRLRRLSGDLSSDYINANFIKGYKSRKVFIAAQGPLDNTVDDFWRMIWEQGVRIVVMVTNLRERCREQCVKYWPDDERPTLAAAGGQLHVRSLKSTYFAEYALREFEVVEMAPPPVGPAAGGSRAPSALSGGAGGDGSPSRPASATVVREGNRPSSRSSGYDGDPPRERRRVFQYHFTCWHDYKAPECVALLRLVGKLRKLDDYNTTPVVVHCSAGVGRTGTMIAIDYLMDQCQEEGRVDVFHCVAEMRQQRNLMVQSVEQYAFIYKALAEHQLFGDTDLSESEFRGYYARLRLPLAVGGAGGGGRERHHSVGSTRSSSARSNSLIGAQSLCASSSTGASRAPPASGARAALLNNTAALSAGIKAKLRLVRGATAASVLNCNGDPVGAAQPPAAVAGTTVGPTPTGITLLDAEFNNLSISLEKPKATDWAQKPENVARNRDPAAVPFDGNRVVLSHFSGYDSTYINASTIKGYFYPYVMAQDPLDAETAFDFWRMVHDQNAYTLVQLTPDEAFTPAERFWPAGGVGQTTLTLGRRGELAVRLLGISSVGGGTGEPSYLVRRLHYRFTTEKDSAGRELVQYVYRQWRPVAASTTSNSAGGSAADSAVPRNVGGFLALAGAVLDRHGQADQPDVGPILVHCRDGASRSGLFAAVALLLERLNSEHMIDVFRTAKGLKLQRTRLFNNTEEYAFLFDCMMEYIGGPSQRTGYRFNT